MSTVFTDDEAALYDRQIRLWGVEAQKRLHKAKILVIGLDGLGAEVCKNIILGGVKSVTMMDHQVVTVMDTASQFLVSRDSLGQNRAAASLVRAQALNPMVDVYASSSSPDEKTDQFFTQFTVICASGCTKGQIIRLNKISRDYGVKFFAGDVFGFISYIFVDLGGSHSYTREVVIPGNKNVPESNKVVNGTSTFGSFLDIVDIKWNKAPVGMLKKTNVGVHAILILLEFVEKFKRPPMPNAAESDSEEIAALAESYIERNALTPTVVDMNLFENIFGKLSPVCAVTGGVLAQEIVKAVSHKDEPISNLFVYNPIAGTGVVEKFSRVDTPLLYDTFA